MDAFGAVSPVRFSDARPPSLRPRTVSGLRPHKATSNFGLVGNAPARWKHAHGFRPSSPDGSSGLRSSLGAEVRRLRAGDALKRIDYAKTYGVDLDRDLYPRPKTGSDTCGSAAGSGGATGSTLDASLRPNGSPTSVATLIFGRDESHAVPDGTGPRCASGFGGGVQPRSRRRRQRQHRRARKLPSRSRQPSQTLQSDAAEPQDHREPLGLTLVPSPAVSPSALRHQFASDVEVRRHANLASSMPEYVGTLRKYDAAAVCKLPSKRTGGRWLSPPAELCADHESHSYGRCLVRKYPTST